VCASRLPLLDERTSLPTCSRCPLASVLSPIPLLRGGGDHPLIVADGYHRVCAGYGYPLHLDL